MADDNRAKIHGAMKTCPVCGRQFWCYDVKLWAYRERTGKARQICSWSCQVKHNAEQEEKRAKRKKYRIPEEPVKRVSKQEEPVKRVPKQERPLIEWFWLVNLREIMSEKKISSQALAIRTKIPGNTIAQWRKLRAKCPGYKLDILVEALGVTREAITEKKTAPRDGSDHTMPETDGNTVDPLYHI